MREFKESIPYQYLHWSEGNNRLFIQYVHGYMKKLRPGYEVVRITDKGRFAVLRKKG